jgi:hypothetical protein
LRTAKRFLFGSKKRTTLSVLGVLSLVAASVALAAWLVHGVGNGIGKAGSLAAVTISTPTQASVTTGDLFPGQDGSLYVNVTNPNTSPVWATSVAGNSAPITSSDTANCPASNVTVNTTTTYTAADDTGNALQVPANATSFLLKLPRVLHMAAAAPNGCQGVYFTTTGGAGFQPDVTFSTVAP